jgi:hypothetical protein
MKRIARKLFKKGAMGLVGFVVARPGLDTFLRQQLFRFPRLAGRARALITRTRRIELRQLPAPVVDEAELTDPARQVLHDLRQALARSRQL